MADTTTKYGLTRDGFRRKRLPEIKTAIETRLADALGTEIQTGANSVIGQLIGVFAYEIADLWEAQEDTYKCMYPSTASGVNLSNAAGLAGINMINAEKTSLVLTLTGTEGTVIPDGAQVSSGDGVIYSCADVGKSITAERATRVEIIVPASITKDAEYSINLNGANHAYTAKDNDTAAIVLSRLSGLIKATGITTTVNNDVLTIAADDKKTAMTVSVNSNLQIDAIASPFTFLCDTAGAIEPALHTVNQIITTYAGWKTADNETAANVGRDAESDISLRKRWSAAVYQRSRAMVESIQNGVYTNVDGVTSCLVYENTSDAADSDGRPPHSIEVVATGGKPEDIAKEIWQRKPAGIDTFGSISNIVFDSQGAQHKINFNRPQEVKVWIRAVVGTNPDEVFPNAALQEIKDAVLAKGSQQNIGEDVILQRYFAAIFESTTGIGYINLTAATGDKPGSYTSDNIVISPRQVAAFDASRIEVTKQ